MLDLFHKNGGDPQISNRDTRGYELLLCQLASAPPPQFEEPTLTPVHDNGPPTMVESARLNTPPANHRDYMIAKGMLLNSGITSDIRDPSLGVKLSPSRTDNYNFETRGPGIIAGLSICIAIMTLITLLRLGLRFWIPRLKWGLDDTLMVPGLVSCHYHLPLLY